MNTVDSLRRAAPEAARLQARVRAALVLLGAADNGPDAVAALEALAPRVADERERFIAANAELGHLVVRQGYALRVLRQAAAALVATLGERQAAEARAAHDDTGEAAAAHAAAQAALPALFEALREALDDTAEDAQASADAEAETVAERDALRVTVDGTTTPPTPADLAARDEAGGLWLVRFRGKWGLFGRGEAESFLRGVTGGWWRADEARWWPLDAAGLVAPVGRQAHEAEELRAEVEAAWARVPCAGSMRGLGVTLAEAIEGLVTGRADARKAARDYLDERAHLARALDAFPALADFGAWERNTQAAWERLRDARRALEDETRASKGGA